MYWVASYFGLKIWGLLCRVTVLRLLPGYSIQARDSGFFLEVQDSRAKGFRV